MFFWKIIFTLYSCSHPSLSKITKEQIKNYKQELSIFAESFDRDGPGAVGDDLEKGTCALISSYEFLYPNQ